MDIKSERLKYASFRVVGTIYQHLPSVSKRPICTRVPFDALITGTSLTVSIAPCFSVEFLHLSVQVYEASITHQEISSFFFFTRKDYFAIYFVRIVLVFPRPSSLSAQCQPISNLDNQMA